MRRVLFAVIALLVFVAGIVVWIVHDANRFKPALIAYVEREVGVSVEMRGGLEWRMQPGFGLLASDLRAVHKGRTWTIDRLLLRPEIVSILRNPTNLAEWLITSVEVDDLLVAIGGGNLRAQRLVFRDIGAERAMPFTAKLVYTRNAWEPIDIELGGSVTFTRNRVRVSNLVFDLPLAEGVCNLEVLMPANRAQARTVTMLTADQGDAVGDLGRARAGVRPAPRAVATAGQSEPRQRAQARPAQDAVLPLEIMRAYDWDGRCDIHRLALAAENVENVQIVLDNKQAGNIVSVRAPSFLGGAAQLQVVVRAGQAPVVWEIEPHLAGVDSHRLGTAFGVDSVLIAPLALGGAIGMQGNTAQRLASSLEADIRFSTAAGTVSVDWIVAPLADIAARLIGGGATPAPTLETKNPAELESANASAFKQASDPGLTSSTIHYENLTGRWRATGNRNRLSLDLDNVKLEVEGNYLILEDQLDVIAAVTFGENARRWGLPLPPSLAALPFHFHCAGALGQPDCRLDARRTFLGDAVDRGRARADEFINSFVPEDYRERAHSLLDALESQVDDALRKDPEGLIEDHVPEKYQDTARSLLEAIQEVSKD